MRMCVEVGLTYDYLSVDCVSLGTPVASLMAHVTRSQLKTTREIVAGKLLRALHSTGLVQGEYRRVRAAYLLTGYAPRTTVYK
jgi:hypothetical protein